MCIVFNCFSVLVRCSCVPVLSILLFSPVIWNCLCSMDIIHQSLCFLDEVSLEFLKQIKLVFEFLGFGFSSLWISFYSFTKLSKIFMSFYLWFMVLAHNVFIIPILKFEFNSFSKILELLRQYFSWKNLWRI